MKSEVLKTPHSRLVYRNYDANGFKDFRSLISFGLEEGFKLEQFILSKTRFQLANSYLYFYFDRPWEPKPSGQYRLGREIIGPPQRDYEEQYFIADFEAGEVTSFLLQDYFSPFEAAEIEHFSPPSKQLGANPLWRIEIEMGSLPPNLRLQFLPLDPGSR